MQRTVPILPIDDYNEAKAYYVDWLGFQVDWEFRFEPTFPVYMQISRDGLVLHLTEHKGGNPGRAMCHMDVDDLDALVAEWKSRRLDFTQKSKSRRGMPSTSPCKTLSEIVWG